MPRNVYNFRAYLDWGNRFKIFTDFSFLCKCFTNLKLNWIPMTERTFIKQTLFFCFCFCYCFFFSFFSIIVTFLTFALDIYELVHNVQEIIVNLTSALKPLKIRYEEIVFILIEMKYKNIKKLCYILLVEHLVNSLELSTLIHSR
jgi:hypothetical protein